MRKTDPKKAREVRRREAYKEYILHAAESVIVRRGYAMMTMDDVAREAGLSKATVYRYVSGKRDLIFQILLHYYDLQKKQLEAILEGEGTAADKLKEAIRSVLKAGTHQIYLSRFFLTDKAGRKIMQNMAEARVKRSSSPEGRFFRTVAARRTEVLASARKIIDAGIAEGRFRAVDSESVTSLVEAVLQGVLHLHFWTEPKCGVGPETEMIYDFVFNGIRNPQGAGEGVTS